MSGAGSKLFDLSLILSSRGYLLPLHMENSMTESSIPIRNSFPVHIQMTIMPNGREYIAFIGVDMGKFERFSIQLKPHDIKDLNAELQQAIEKVAGSFEVEGAYNSALQN